MVWLSSLSLSAAAAASFAPAAAPAIKDGIEIAVNGRWGKLPQLHLANHALPQRGHGVLLKALYEAAITRGHEGVMAKHLAATYLPGRTKPAFSDLVAACKDHDSSAREVS
jgi:hypothetical protein